MTLGREAIDWWEAEGDLVDDGSQTNPRIRFRATREVRELWTPEIDASVWHARSTLLGLLVLLLAAGFAIIAAIPEGIG